MPPMPPKVEAIFTADWHLSLRPPVARSCEDDWFDVMGRHLRQLKDLSQPMVNGILQGPIPIIVAGDIFDKWNAPAELINFAIEEMPTVYAIPGNHDLPNHSYDQYPRSAYKTLELAGRVIDIDPNFPHTINNLRFWSFPFGMKIDPCEDKNSMLWDIAVVHQYVWKKNCGYNGAPDNCRIGKFRKALKNYDLAVFGDNHIPFYWDKWECPILNCGSLMRRNIDQIKYRPAVWLLMSDKTIKRHYLDVSEDKFLEPDYLKNLKVNGIKMGKFLANLKDLKDVAISFDEAVKRYLLSHNVKPEVEQIILSIIDEWR